jgi:hypothetical protein
MDRLAEMVQYVRKKNIDRYRKLLDEPTDPLRRQQLQQQLAELESGGTAAPKGGALADFHSTVASESICDNHTGRALFAYILRVTVRRKARAS